MMQSISELSILTGIDRRRITRLLADLPSERGRKGARLYESTDALPMLYLAPGENDTYDLTQERARLAHHQANKAALEEEVFRGEYVRSEEVTELVGSEYAKVRARLLAIPTRLAPQLLGLECNREAHALVMAAVEDALAELSADEAE